MALDDIQDKYIPRENSFYREHYAHILIAVMGFVFVIILLNGFLLYQLANRPLPVFTAVEPDGKTMALTPYDHPNLQPDVITRFASEAATYAYTFDFASYKDQIQQVKKYFTPDGWNDYLLSVDPLITTLVAKQLAANGVVTGPAVINNEGELYGKGYSWRVAVPFSVTYLSADSRAQNSFMVVITIVKVPTSENKQGLGIDQLVMYKTGTH
jgi:intracellular multiplication protein IcmL